jgi:hypothetical protein
MTTQTPQQMRAALAVFSKWAIDVSTLGELGDLEARMREVGIDLQQVGEWSSPLAIDQANTTVSDLLPCPLCGRALMHTASNAQAGIREPYFEHIDGRDCVLRYMMFLDRPDLVAAWNRRASADVTDVQAVAVLNAFYGEAWGTSRGPVGAKDRAAAMQRALAALNPPMGR